MRDGDADDGPGYDGPLTLRRGDDAVEVTGKLRGYFEPLDGRFHWYGRLQPDEQLDAWCASGPVDVVVRTVHGEAPARLGDADLWGRQRVTGQGRPPFAVDEPLSQTSASSVQGRV